MRPTSAPPARRLLPLLALALFLGAAWGCNGPSTTPAEPSTSDVQPLPSTSSESEPAAPSSYEEAPGQAAKRSSALTKLAADWGKPDAVLLLSGQMLGYLEPCGCSEDQKGGLGRRFDLIAQIKDKGWPVLPIDLGSLVNDPRGRGGPEQAKIKFGVALRALRAMDYAAFAASTDDLRIGVLDALSAYLQDDTLKAVSANLIPGSGLDTAIVPSVRAEAGPFKIGITAVVDPRLLENLSDAAKDDFLNVKPPAEALAPVLADLERDTEIRVLLVQGPEELGRSLAEQYPGFQVVVAASPYPEPPEADPIPLNGGKTLLVMMGKKGMHVGLLGLFRQGPERLRFRDIVLNKIGFANAEPMRQLIDEDMQAIFKDAAVVENYPRREHPTGATFLGAKACQSCHPMTYARWESTQHSHGFESLVKRKRTFDAECASCHTTGFEYTSGFHSAEASPFLMGNGCENCHGPGSKHAQAPDDLNFRKAMALTPEIAKKDLCVRCHDDDNSPKFHFETYYGKIIHKKMDTYDDPRVHQGLTLDPSR